MLGVLDSAEIELIFFLVAGIVLCFGFTERWEKTNAKVRYAIDHGGKKNFTKSRELLLMAQLQGFDSNHMVT